MKKLRPSIFSYWWLRFTGSANDAKQVTWWDNQVWPTRGHKTKIGARMFSASRNWILLAMVNAWQSLHNLKHVNIADLLNVTETRGHHKIRTSLNIKRKVHHTVPNPLCWKIARGASNKVKLQKRFSKWKMLNLWPFLGHLWDFYHIRSITPLRHAPFLHIEKAIKILGFFFKRLTF